MLIGCRKLVMFVALLALGGVLVGGCASDTTSAQQGGEPAVARVSGTEGVVYSGVYGIIGGGGESHTINGGTIGESSKDYELTVPPGERSFGTFWKDQGSGGTLKAQMVVNDKDVAEDETSEDWGAVEVEWPPRNEETTGGQTTGGE